jgi:hypothetical protein
MPTPNDHLRLAQECAALAGRAQWPETRDVWEQVERLCLALARHQARMTMGLKSLHDRDGSR